MLGDRFSNCILIASRQHQAHPNSAKKMPVADHSNCFGKHSASRQNQQLFNFATYDLIIGNENGFNLPFARINLFRPRRFVPD